MSIWFSRFSALALLATAAGLPSRADAASFDWSPGPTVLVGESVTLRASGVSPPSSAGWDFDADGIVDRTGAEVVWRFELPGLADVRLLDGAGTVVAVATIEARLTFDSDEIVATELSIPVSTPASLRQEVDRKQRDTADVAPPGTPLLNGPVVLTATLHRPDPAVSAGPRPIVVALPGWGGTKEDFAGDGADGCRAYAREGLLCLAVTPRGRTGSDGWAGLAEREAADVIDLLSWIAVPARAGSFGVRLDGAGDPRVGLLGRSVGATTALVVAGRDPRVDAVSAIVPAANHWKVATFGGIPRWRFLAGFGLGAGTTAAPAPGGPETLRWSVESILGLDEVTKRELEESSPLASAATVVAPVLLFNGWLDDQHPVDAPIDNYLAIANNPVFQALGAARHERLKMEIFPAGHAGPPNGAVVFHGRSHLWFQHWLDGRSGAYRGVVARFAGAEDAPVASIDDFIASPAVKLWQYRGSGDSATLSLETPKPWVDPSAFDRWVAAGPPPAGSHAYDPWADVDLRVYDTWPPPRAPEVAYRLGSLGTGTEGQLVTGTKTAPEAEATFVNLPITGTTSPSAGAQVRSRELVLADSSAPGSLRYLSSPLQRDLSVIGAPRLQAPLLTSVAGPLARGLASVHLVAKLYDVPPSGAPFLAFRGYLSVPLDNRQVPGTPVGPAAGRRIALDLEFLNGDWTFPEGHRLLLVLSHGDVANVVPSLVPSVTTVSHDGGAARLTLPVAAR